MSLELKFSIIQSQNCKSFQLQDDTGAYDANSNPTGYNPPNPATADMQMASLAILMADGTTVTIDVFPTMPNTNGIPFTILNTDLGLAADVAISDWVSQMTYHVSENSDGSDGYSTTQFVFISCQSECCRANALADVRFDTDCNDCKNQKLNRYNKINALVEAIYSNLECDPQLPNKAAENLTSLTALCACADCGCN